jgi:hypothetical protein
MHLISDKNKNTILFRKNHLAVTSKIKLLVGILILLVSANLMVSCFAEEEPEGFGDAFIVTEIVGQDTLKGLSLHAFSYTDFLSVSAYFSGMISTPYNLSPYMGFKQDFIWSMPISQFSKNLPATGDYVFNAIYKDGQSQVFYDKLTADYILPPVIKVCEYVTSSERVDVEWSAVSKADVYNIKLMNLNDSVLFASDVYNSSITNYSFGKNTKGWQSSTYPTAGQNVKVEVAAYLLESASSLKDLQAVSKSRKTITWGKAN